MRIEQPVQINLALAGQSAVLQKFAGLKAGDVVSAKILRIEGNKLLIRMQGADLQAEFKGELFFLPGDQLDLTLASRTSRTVSFRLSSVNGQSLRMEVSETEENLLRSGIEPTGQNIAASRILLQNGYTPTAQNLENFSRIMQENPQMPHDLSAFFAANAIEPDTEAVQILTQIQQEPSLLGNRADALATALRQLYPSAAQALSPNLPAAAVPAGQPSVQPSNQPFAGVRSAESPDPGVTAAMQQNAGVATNNPPIEAFRSVGSRQPQALGEFLPAILKSLQKNHLQAAQAIAGSERLPELMEQLPHMQPGEAKSAIQNFVASLHLSPKDERAVIGSINTVFGRTTERLPESEQPSSPLSESDSESKSIPAEKSDFIDPSKPQAPQTAVSSGSSSPNVPLLHTVFQYLTELFATVLPSDSAASAESLRNVIRGQEKLSEELQSSVAGLAGEKHAVTGQVAEMRSQINLNSCMENFFYYQIPIQYREQKTTAELYVFERNRHKSGSREDCTILIALDTQNMGRCETILRADGGGLDIRLRLGSQDLCSFAQANELKLRKYLADAGFQIKNLTFEVLQEKTTPLNAQSVFTGLRSFVPGALNIQI